MFRKALSHIVFVTVILILGLLVFAPLKPLIVNAQHGGSGAHDSTRDYLGRVNTNIEPSANNTYSLGSTTKKFKTADIITLNATNVSVSAITGLTSNGVVTTSGGIGTLGVATNSTLLAGSISDETGTGALVFATNSTLAGTTTANIANVTTINTTDINASGTVRGVAEVISGDADEQGAFSLFSGEANETSASLIFEGDASGTAYDYTLPANYPAADSTALIMHANGVMGFDTDVARYSYGANNFNGTGNITTTGNFSANVANLTTARVSSLSTNSIPYIGTAGLLTTSPNATFIDGATANMAITGDINVSGNVASGAYEYAADAGMVTGWFMPTTTAANGIQQSVTTMIGNVPFFKMYSVGTATANAVDNATFEIFPPVQYPQQSVATAAETYSITPTSSYIEIVSNNATGTTMSMATAANRAGLWYRLKNIGANTCTFLDDNSTMDLNGNQVLTANSTLILGLDSLGMYAQEGGSINQ